ncbi:hypothetical protein [Altericista sp. CCNU0014]|uniref:hypothetical protein n=1 Tax=Altericista sp. CCNU0014 TaxID=3082949 RepID=UPI00384CFE06
MNLRHSASSGIGLLTLLFGFMPSTPAQTSLPVPLVPKQGQAKGIDKTSSGLGGPITPSHPNFFSDSAPPPAPAPLDLDDDFAVQPLRTPSSAPVAPLVGDPPRTNRGGLINIETD